MGTIVDRTGKGASLSKDDYDSNVQALHGVCVGVSAASYSISSSNQGDTIECTNAGVCTVTLPQISTIDKDTDDFKVTILAGAGSGGVTINRSSTDTIGVSAATSLSLIGPGGFITLQTDSTAGIWSIINSSELLGDKLVFRERSAPTQTALAAKGEIWVENATPNKPRFENDAGDSLSIAVGGPEETDHTLAGHNQNWDGRAFAGTTHFNFDFRTAIAASTWESIGPTGSGADNIWTTLDKVPDRAKILVLGIQVRAPYSASGNNLMETYAVKGDVVSPVRSLYNLIATVGCDTPNSGASGFSQCGNMFFMPVDDDKTFQLSWKSTYGTPFGWLYYLGFLEE